MKVTLHCNCAFSTRYSDCWKTGTVDRAKEAPNMYRISTYTTSGVKKTTENIWTRRNECTRTNRQEAVPVVAYKQTQIWWFVT